MDKTKILDFESDERAVELLFKEAAQKAKNDFEINFVREQHERYEEYGMGSFMSQKQYDILIKVADW